MKRKMLWMIAAMLALFQGVSAASDGKFWTEFAEKPVFNDEKMTIYVYTPEHLAWLAVSYFGGNDGWEFYDIRQMADIDLSAHEWVPIGNNGNIFISNYYGNGFKITGLHCDRPNEDNVGLFGRVGYLHKNVERQKIVSGSVNDVILLNSTIIGKNNVGGICGAALGNINRNVTDASVKGNENVGGIVGCSLYEVLYLWFSPVCHYPSIQENLYIGSDVEATGNKDSRSTILGHLNYSTNDYSFGNKIRNNYYLNSKAAGINSNDVQAYPVYYDKTKGVDYSFSGGVYYNSAQYVTKKGIKVTVKASDAVNSITAVSLNGRSLCTEAGIYELVLQDNENEGTLTSSINLNKLSGEGTEANPYLINNETDWRVLAEMIRRGNTFKGKFVRLNTYRIKVSEMLGTPDYPFEGTFDGGSNDLEFYMGSKDAPFAEMYCAPFRYYAGPLIKDLTVFGEIHTSGRYTGGLIGRLFNESISGQTTEIRNCLLYIGIYSSHEGDGYHAGFVAAKEGADNSLKFYNCFFNGSLEGSKTYTCAGFIASAYQNSSDVKNGVSLENCAYHPTSVTVNLETMRAFSQSELQSYKRIYMNKDYSPNDPIKDKIKQTGDDNDEVIGKTLYETWRCSFFERGISILSYEGKIAYMSAIDYRPDKDNTKDLKDDNGCTVDAYIKGKTLPKDGKLHGMCLPFNASLTDGPLAGAKAYKMTSSTLSDFKLNVTFEKVDATTLEAGVPYLMYYGNDGSVDNKVIFDQVVINNTEAPVVDANVGFYSGYGRKAVSAAERSKTFLVEGSNIYDDVTSINAFDTYLMLKTEENVSDITITVKGDGEDIVFNKMAGLMGDGTEQRPLLIQNASDWEWLANKVKNGETFSGKEFRLTTDISTSITLGAKVGDVEHYFEGNFDGGGNTLTFNIPAEDAASDGDYVAPFSYYGGSKIKNLTVEGTINSKGRYAAGLVGALFKDSDEKTLYITDCQVSATLQSIYNGEGNLSGHFGGFVGEKRGTATNLNIERCVFDGELLGEKTYAGNGFVGEIHVGFLEYMSRVVLNDCLTAPKKMTMIKDFSFAFVRMPYEVNNCYYTNWSGETLSQGKEAILFDNVESKSFGNVKESNTFLNVYDKAILFDGVFYADIPFEGIGSEAEPYLIKTADQFMEMGDLFNGSAAARMQGKYFKQTANIDFDINEVNNYTPIIKFNGYYDGDGHIISGVNIMNQGTGANDDGALFLNVEDGSVKNVILRNSTIEGSCAGAIATRLLGTSTIENCHVLKDVAVRSNHYYAGGIVGYFTTGTPTVKNCSSQATVIANQANVGGLVGGAYIGEITNCMYLGNNVVTYQGNRSYQAVAYNNGGKVTDCYYTSEALSDDNAQLMPDVEMDNTEFFTKLAARDEYLRKAGLTNEEIGYDMTLNNRILHSKPKPRGEWVKKAYVVCLPFDMNITEIFGDTDEFEVYDLEYVNFAENELIFVNEFPLLEAGKPYVVVVNVGSLPLYAENVTIKATPAEGKAVKDIATDEVVGFWKGTYTMMNNNDLLAENAFFMQPLGIFKHSAPRYVNCSISPFTAYFAATSDDVMTNKKYQMKYRHIENGEIVSEAVDFPAEEYDFLYEITDDIETDIHGVYENESQAPQSKDNSIYTLDGRRLDNMPTRGGIYIVNGKKIVK